MLRAKTRLGRAIVGAILTLTFLLGVEILIILSFMAIDYLLSLPIILVR